MRQLHAGVDSTVIAHWRARAINSTNIYLHPDMTTKEHAIAKIALHDVVAGRYQPPDAVLVFLASL